MKPFIALLCKRGHTLHIIPRRYAGNGQTRQGLERMIGHIVSLLQLLGFQINWTKSVLVPSRVIQYLGLIVDAVTMTLFLPDGRPKGIVEACQVASTKTTFQPAT